MSMNQCLSWRFRGIHVVMNIVVSSVFVLIMCFMIQQLKRVRSGLCHSIVHNPCSQSTFHADWFWKEKFRKQWLVVLVTQISSCEDMRRKLQISLSFLSATVEANPANHQLNVNFFPASVWVMGEYWVTPKWAPFTCNAFAANRRLNHYLFFLNIVSLPVALCCDRLFATEKKSCEIVNAVISLHCETFFNFQVQFCKIFSIPSS